MRNTTPHQLNLIYFQQYTMQFNLLTSKTYQLVLCTRTLHSDEIVIKIRNY